MTYEHQSERLSTAVEEACCGTACLVQPRFFHGQLLTDADLNQLLSWTESKFRLQRAINGWGVVCGLELSLDPEHPTHVMIHPGQGIDCCGRDLVVCEQISFDLSDACPKEECLEPPYNRWGKTNREETKEDSEYEKPQTKISSPTDLFQGSQVLDLFLHYSTEGSDSQLGLGRGRAGQGSECQYSRLKETVTVKWEPASDPQKADTQSLDNFVKSYQEVCLANLTRLQYAHDKVTREELLKPWLLEHLELQPLQEFGFVRDWIKAMESSDLADNAARIMFFMNMDALLAWRRCGCPSCTSEMGLLVGRAWLQGPDTSGSTSCRVVYVNSQPPFRRELHDEPCYPTLPGCVNLAPYLWQDWNIFKESLTRLGVAIGQPDERKFDELNWEILEKLYTQTDRIINCDAVGRPSPIQATVVSLDPPFGSRVVGFS